MMRKIKLSKRASDRLEKLLEYLELESKLFDIKTFLVLPKNKASQLFTWIS